MIDERMDAAAASASLNKTISELMIYLEDEGVRPSVDLRKRIYEKMADVAAWWAQEGFYWGHKESQLAIEGHGEIPATLTLYYGEAHLAPNCWRVLDLTSRTRRKA